MCLCAAIKLTSIDHTQHSDGCQQGSRSPSSSAV